MSNKQLNAKSITRIAAIQIMYQIKDVNSEKDLEMLINRMINMHSQNDVWEDYGINFEEFKKIKFSKGFLKELVECTYTQLAEIDGIITTNLTKNWTLKSLPKLLKSILRVGISEIKYFPKTPKKVVINEYTDISNELLEEAEIGFVNSLLDKLAFEK